MDLNYTIDGEGDRAIVLVHYFGGSNQSWQWVVRRLRKEFKVVSICLPGFGNTQPLEDLSIFSFANYINQCIEELELKNYVLCGHSMGGKLILYAQQLALHNRASGLVLIAPSPPTMEKMDEQDKENMLSLSDRHAAMVNVDKATFKSLKKKKLTVAIDSQLQVDAKTREWWVESGMTDDISERIPGLEAPTFVICAKEDPIIPMGEIYDSVMPHLYRPRLIQLTKCGHLVPLEAPRRLSKRLMKIAGRLLS